MSLIKAVAYISVVILFRVVLMFGSFIGAIMEGAICGTAREIRNWWEAWSELNQCTIESIKQCWRDR
ncbi:MAG: hypothetical protein ACRC8I_11595 [Plesiomonas shigelloides]